MRSLLAFATFWAALSLCACQHAAPLAAVRSLSRTVDTTRPDSQMCSDWVMTRADVARYFSVADAVDPATFHDQAMILPCSVQGQITLRNRAYRYQIYAGGAGYLFDGAAVNARYLCRKRCAAALPHLP